MDLKFRDWIDRIKGNLGKEEWITAYSSNENDFESATFHCALIPNDKVKKSLSDPSWDLRIGSGFPGFVIHFKNRKKIREYYRFSDSGIEPLVFLRSFHGVKEEYLEIVEEFRHYFNLYGDKKNKKFINIDDNGDEEDVVLMGENEIKIKLKFLKEFLAVKKMHLAIYFDFFRFSEKTIEEVGIEESRKIIRKDNYIYSVGACNSDSFGDCKRKSQGWLRGKKLIAGLEDFKQRPKEEYEDFIIGVDEDGNGVLHTCNPKELSESRFLTPVFFRKGVLNDYYSNPKKYSVGDGYLRFAGLCGLRMDNNHPKYVVVYLGDLGQCLSIKEQKRWKCFNITPQGSGISRTAWERDFEAKFSDPERSDLYFKQKFQIFQENWDKKFGWKLFKPLSNEDEHHLKSLRIPLTNEQKEFDEQVLSITKIFIDSLNEKELEKVIKITKENAKGIDKLEAFLNSKHIRFKGLIEFLRDLQELRSTGAAHRKGKNYEKIKKKFLIGEKDLSDVFNDILIKCIQTLNSLENYFLKENNLLLRLAKPGNLPKED